MHSSVGIINLNVNHEFIPTCTIFTNNAYIVRDRMTCQCYTIVKRCQLTKSRIKQALLYANRTQLFVAKLNVISYELPFSVTDRIAVHS